MSNTSLLFRQSTRLQVAVNRQSTRRTQLAELTPSTRVIHWPECAISLCAHCGACTTSSVPIADTRALPAPQSEQPNHALAKQPDQAVVILATSSDLEPPAPLLSPARAFDPDDICTLQLSELGRPDLACIAVDGQRIRAPRVIFEVGKGVIMPQSFTGLDSVVALLQRYPQMRLTIEGHKDHTGDNHY